MVIPVIGEIEEIIWSEATHTHIPCIMLTLVPVSDRVVHDSQQSEKNKGNAIEYMGRIPYLWYQNKKNFQKLKVFHNLFGGKSGPDFIWAFHKSLLTQLSVCSYVSLQKY